MAEIVAKRSPDAETQVGSILVRESNLTLMSTGFNGFVAGAPDHRMPNTRPHKYPFILHSEMNLISNCAKNGISTDNCFVVCTMSPCMQCVRMLINSGVRRVIAKQLYKDFQEVQQMIDVNVQFSTDENGFFDIRYNPVI